MSFNIHENSEYFTIHVMPLFSPLPSFMYFQFIINTCLWNTIPNFQWYILHSSWLELTHRLYWNPNFSLWDTYFFSTKELNFHSVRVLCFSCRLEMIISFTSPWYKFASYQDEQFLLFKWVRPNLSVYIWYGIQTPSFRKITWTSVHFTKSHFQTL